MGNAYLYVSEDKGRAVSVFQMGDQGDLTALQRLDVGGRVVPMTVAPDKQTLYAAVRGDRFELVTMAIDAASGQLSVLGRTPALESATYISIDQTGRFLLAAFNVVEEPRTGLVASYPIGPDRLVQPPVLMVRTQPKSHAIITDATNRFAIATICNGDIIMRFRFDAENGELSADGLAPVIVRPGSGPRHVKFHPSGRTFYLMNEYDGAVIVFRWSSEKGVLSEIQTVSAVPPGQMPADDWHGGWRGADLCLTPDGRYLYASVRNSSTIAWFSVNSEDGSLTPAGQIATAREPRGLALDDAGRFLFASGMEEDLLSAFSIDTGNGALTLASTTPTGKGPNWIEFVRLP